LETPTLKLNPPIVGSSEATESLVRLVMQLADTGATILITGESGTGKELVARNLHWCSGRRDKPFVAINCAALSPGILESELFGHGRGAFTGAVSAHPGLFEQAESGTLLLDEIGEVPGFIQAKLLRVLQGGEVRRMGSTQCKQVDVRIVAATNTDLEDKVHRGEFREDLFYRLNVVRVHLAPLRERPDDLQDLIDFFFQSRSRPVPRLADETRQLFFRHPWPGNVRELHNELERLLALYPRLKEVRPDMLSPRIVHGYNGDALDMRLLYETPLPKAVGYLEKNLLRKTLQQMNWNKSRSARKLGLSRQGLLKKIKRYGISEHGSLSDKTSEDERIKGPRD